MYKRQCLLILITGIFIFLFANAVGKAAPNAQVISSPAYIPLVFKDTTFILDQVGFIGVDSNNYANTYIYKINEDGSGLKNLTDRTDPISQLFLVAQMDRRLPLIHFG